MVYLNCVGCQRNPYRTRNAGFFAGVTFRAAPSRLRSTGRRSRRGSSPGRVPWTIGWRWYRPVPTNSWRSVPLRVLSGRRAGKLARTRLGTMLCGRSSTRDRLYPTHVVLYSKWGIQRKSTLRWHSTSESSRRVILGCDMLLFHSVCLLRSSPSKWRKLEHNRWMQRRFDTVVRAHAPVSFDLFSVQSWSVKTHKSSFIQNYHYVTRLDLSQSICSLSWKR